MTCQYYLSNAYKYHDVACSIFSTLSTTMENFKLMISSFLLVFFLSSSNLCLVMSKGSQTNGAAYGIQIYIIQLSLPPNTTFDRREDLESWYRSFLPNPTNVSSLSRMVYQYSDAIVGFAAKLTEDEVKEMQKKEGFLKAYPDRTLSLLTTHTPAFLGLQGANGFWNGSNFGKGVIIGMLDTGIVPDHPSFSGQGMSPPPSKWKGPCEFKKLGCNNKVIGGRAFDLLEDDAPIDEEGHGTHTASTAAGNFVTNAAVLGNGNGTAVGMAPRAHLAIYRVCTSLGCSTSAILAGMDAAIKDGVDILSLSLGADVHKYHDDIIAIGAFSAVEKGIFVSCAAGNSGPYSGSLNNEAPWVLTVGASTMDRSIRVTIKLGDGQELNGESVFQPDNFTSAMLPLVRPPTFDSDMTNCIPRSLRNVKGKIVVCKTSMFITTVEIGSMVKRAGGAAMILVNEESDGYTTLAEAHVLPASRISYHDRERITSYFNSSSGNPTASLIFKGTIIGNDSAPAIAFFSSRGPSKASPHILKPDIIGPGVNVLAGWPFPVGSSQKGGNSHTFNIISGTSMSTPHLSGIAALVKSMHPDWSPAAIKSAIMTTSDVACHDGKPIINEQRKPASYFMMGAGHVNPEKASDPGLVYDLSVEEYISFLCGLGYTDHEVTVVARRKITCANIKKINESELNYPSITVSIKSGEITVSRTVTHVSETSEKYSIKVEMPEGIKVSVVPETLEFSKLNEKKTFVVTLKRSREGKGGAEGQLKWVSNKHVVRSPIVVVE